MAACGFDECRDVEEMVLSGRQQRSEKMGETEKLDKAPKQSWFTGLSAEFKKIVWPDKKSLARQTTAVVAVSVVLGLVIAILDFGIKYGVEFLTGLSF